MSSSFDSDIRYPAPTKERARDLGETCNIFLDSRRFEESVEQLFMEEAWSRPHAERGRKRCTKQNMGGKRVVETTPLGRRLVT